MILGSFSHHEVMEMAATIEQRGYKLYIRAAETVKEEPARNILLHLAEQEKEHEKYFRKLYKDLEEGKEVISQELDESTVAYLKAIAQSSIFPVRDQQFLEQVVKLEDVIRVGKQAEKDSILFYYELSRFAVDEETEKFYQALIKEEKMHLVQLQDLEKLIDERGVVY